MGKGKHRKIQGILVCVLMVLATCLICTESYAWRGGRRGGGYCVSGDTSGGGTQSFPYNESDNGQHIYHSYNGNKSPYYYPSSSDRGQTYTINTPQGARTYKTEQGQTPGPRYFVGNDGRQYWVAVPVDKAKETTTTAKASVAATSEQQKKANAILGYIAGTTKPGSAEDKLFWSMSRSADFDTHTTNNTPENIVKHAQALGITDAKALAEIKTAAEQRAARIAKDEAAARTATLEAAAAQVPQLEKANADLQKALAEARREQLNMQSLFDIEIARDRDLAAQRYYEKSTKNLLMELRLDPQASTLGAHGGWVITAGSWDRLSKAFAKGIEVQKGMAKWDEQKGVFTEDKPTFLLGRFIPAASKVEDLKAFDHFTKLKAAQSELKGGDGMFIKGFAYFVPGSLPSSAPFAKLEWTPAPDVKDKQYKFSVGDLTALQNALNQHGTLMYATIYQKWENKAWSGSEVRGPLMTSFTQLGDWYTKHVLQEQAKQN